MINEGVITLTVTT